MSGTINSFHDDFVCSHQQAVHFPEMFLLYSTRGLARMFLQKFYQGGWREKTLLEAMAEVINGGPGLPWSTMKCCSEHVLACDPAQISQPLESTMIFPSNTQQAQNSGADLANIHHVPLRHTGE